MLMGLILLLMVVLRFSEQLIEEDCRRRVAHKLVRM